MRSSAALSDLLKYYLPAASFLLSAGLVSIRRRPRVRRILRRAGSAGARFAGRKGLACSAVAIFILTVRAVLLPVWPRPLPRVYDEYSYLLMADTFASGRLTNLSPPHWEHFETPFVLLRPTYQSAYPPAQGIVLAIGKLCLGHPWWGVWLAMGLAGGAICWMAQAWLPPKWALLGGLLASLQFCISGYWMNGYWGGAPAAIGGAILLGAWPRFARRPTGAMGATVAAGLLLLANSRPWEGLLLASVVLVLLAFDLRRAPERPHWRVFAPATGVLLIGMFLMAWYFRSVTGNPLRMPYQEAFEQYAAGGMFFWQPLKPTHYRHPELEQFYWTMAAFGRARYANLAGVLLASFAKLYVVAQFYVGPLVFTVFAALPLLARNRRSRRLLFCLAAIAVANFATTYLQVHYSAPAASLFVVLSCSSLRVFRLMQHRGWTIGAYLVPALCILMATSFMAALPYAMSQPAPAARQRVLDALCRSGQRHLVFVRYGANHLAVEAEWIYNEADLAASQVIWAWDMGADKNRQVAQSYPGRRLWLIQPDNHMEPGQDSPKVLAYTF